MNILENMIVENKTFMIVGSRADEYDIEEFNNVVEELKTEKNAQWIIKASKGTSINSNPTIKELIRVKYEDGHLYIQAISAEEKILFMKFASADAERIVSFELVL